MNVEDRIPVSEAALVFRRARDSGLVSAADTSVIFHDLGRMVARIRSLTNAFPNGTLHAIAVKANPVLEILRRAVDFGAGLEAASIEEVHLALAAGSAPERIVFDSPAKTCDELEFALRTGVLVNADNLVELERIDRVLDMIETPGRVGLRINPEVEAGSIAATSVATSNSRFGVPLERAFDSVVEAFRQRPWLGCLHVHVGSQGCNLGALVQGVAKVWRLRDMLHRAVGREQVDSIDIGGGLPAAYAPLDSPPSFADYAGALRREVPGLFGDNVRLVTEFGRSIHAGCGFAVSRVEYVKTTGEGRVAVVHLGADLLLRPVYEPQHWHHEFAVLDSAGTAKTGPLLPWTIAGPLCFAGDIIGHGLSLPEIRAGDYVLIRDVGAYAVSMWSRHCSRAMPLMLGYEDSVSGSSAPFTVLRSRERTADIVKHWGL